MATDEQLAKRAETIGGLKARLDVVEILLGIAKNASATNADRIAAAELYLANRCGADYVKR